MANKSLLNTCDVTGSVLGTEDLEATSIPIPVFLAPALMESVI